MDAAETVETDRTVTRTATSSGTSGMTMSDEGSDATATGMKTGKGLQARIEADATSGNLFGLATVVGTIPPQAGGSVR